MDLSRFDSGLDRRLSTFKETGRWYIYTQREAVRLARNSGLTRKQVAADLGIGLSTLGKWISAYRPEAPADLPSADLLKEIEQLRRENRILKEGETG